MLWDLETFWISLFCLGLVAGLFVSEGWGFVYLPSWESRWEAGPFQRWKLLRPDANTSGCQQPGHEPADLHARMLLPRTLKLESLMQSSQAAWTSLGPRLATKDLVFLGHDLGRGASTQFSLAAPQVSEPGSWGFCELPDSPVRNSFSVRTARVGFRCS